MTRRNSIDLTMAEIDRFFGTLDTGDKLIALIDELNAIESDEAETFVASMAREYAPRRIAD